MQIRQKIKWLQNDKIAGMLTMLCAAARLQTSAELTLRTTTVMCCVMAAFTACEQDTYDKGDGYFSDIQATFCEAHSNSSKAIDYIVTDDGEKLQLTAPFTSRSITTPDSLYRMAIYYNKVEQNKVDVMSMGMVPTMDIADADKFENLVIDPVKFESAWVSKNRKYINFALWLKVGVVGEGVDKHTLGMVRMETCINTDGTTTAVMRLHHSQGEVPEHYSQKYYVSLLASQVDTDSLCLLVNTYDGEIERRLRIK